MAVVFRWDAVPLVAVRLDAVPLLLAWFALGAVAVVLLVLDTLTRSIFSYLSDFIPWAVTCTATT